MPEDNYGEGDSEKEHAYPVLKHLEEVKVTKEELEKVRKENAPLYKDTLSAS